MREQQRNFKISVRWTILSIVLLLLLGLFVANHMVRTQVRDSGEWLELHDATEQQGEAIKAAIDTLIEYRFWIYELTNALLLKDQYRVLSAQQRVAELELILIARIKGLPSVSQNKRDYFVSLIKKIQLIEDEDLTSVRNGGLYEGGARFRTIKQTLEVLRNALGKVADEQEHLLHAQYTEIEDQLNNLVDLSKWIVAVGIVGATIVAWVLVAWVFRPLGQISTALDHLSRGETQVSVPRS